MRHSFRTFVSFCLAALLFLAGAVAAAETGVIRVGTTAAQTGKYGDLGVEQLQGLTMWAADLNSRGALLGKRVEVVAYDDGSDPTRVAELYERLITEDRVDFLKSGIEIMLGVTLRAYQDRQIHDVVAADFGHNDIVITVTAHRGPEQAEQLVLRFRAV